MYLSFLSLLAGGAWAGTLVVYAPPHDCNLVAPELNTCNYTSYAALGDSYSAGLNAIPGGDLLGQTCGRNVGAYPELMQQAFSFPNYQFLACSGADTTACDQDQVKSPQYHTQDLVSITIGGDNSHIFFYTILACVYSTDPATCANEINAANATIEDIMPDIDTLFADIKTTKPKRVVVLGYPQLWSTTNANACQSPVLANVSMSARTAMNSLIVEMNVALLSAAQSFGFTFVDTDGYFDGNRLCDDVSDPYIQYPSTTAITAESQNGVFHPTAVGQQMLFRALSVGAGCSFYR